MKVYRMQNEAGVGPYRGLKATFWQSCPHDVDHGRPTPCSEGWSPSISHMHQKHGPGNVLFCFTSRHNAEAWFDEEEREVLANRGYTLQEIEAPVVRVSPSGLQAVYIKRR